MNAPELHLLINHVPVLGSLFAVLLLLAGMVGRSPALVRAALVAYVLVALATVPTFMTGGPAAHEVRAWPGVERRDIHAHSESADKTLIAEGMAGLVALAALVAARRRSDRSLPGWAPAAALVLGLAATGLAAWTSHLGGLVRHPELRAGAVPPGGASTPAARPAEPGGS